MEISFDLFSLLLIMTLTGYIVHRVSLNFNIQGKSLIPIDQGLIRSDMIQRKKLNTTTHFFMVKKKIPAIKDHKSTSDETDSLPWK